MEEESRFDIFPRKASTNLFLDSLEVTDILRMSKGASRKICGVGDDTSSVTVSEWEGCGQHFLPIENN